MLKPRIALALTLAALFAGGCGGEPQPVEQDEEGIEQQEGQEEQEGQEQEGGD